MCTKVVETSRIWANVPSSSPPYSVSARDAPVWCSDPHDLSIVSQSRPSSTGVQARSNLRTSEWGGSGLWTCGRCGKGCRSLHASANPWLSRSLWRCSGHRRRPQRWTSTQDKFLNTFSILLYNILHICSEIPIPDIFLLILILLLSEQSQCDSLLMEKKISWFEIFNLYHTA